MVNVIPPVNPIESLLAARGTAIVDGGLATELEARGHSLDDELWSARLLARDPRSLAEVHADYAAAGADVIISASYQATLAGFQRLEGCSVDEAAALLRRSVELACQARGTAEVLVAASVGPYGAARADGSEYTGDYDLDADGLYRWHRDRFRILAASGADMLAMETVPSLAEARALMRLLDEVPDVYGWISFSCRDGAHLADGTPFAECVDALAGHPRLAAIGANCTAPQHTEQLVSIACERSSVPVVVYPNSGETWDAEARCWRGDCRLEGFVDEAVRWRDAGARLIGGCCRTGPRHIRRLRARLAG